MKIKGIILLFCVIVLQGAIKANAQIEKFKAAYVYNFSQQMKWPDDQKSSEFIIGILDKDQTLANALKATTAKRTVGNQSIKIEVFKNTNDIKQCHILYVSGNQTGTLKKAIAMLGQFPTVVITENPNQTPAESVINLFIKNDKLAFTLNKDNAVFKKITVSEKLRLLSKRQ